MLQRRYLQQYGTQTHYRCCRKYSVRNDTNRNKYSKLSSEAELHCGSSGKEDRSFTKNSFPYILKMMVIMMMMMMMMMMMVIIIIIIIIILILIS